MYSWWWWLFPHLRGFWENIWPFPACTFFFFFKVEIILCTLIPLFMPGSVHSGSVSRDSMHSHYVWTAADSPLQLCWVKGVCVFRCNVPPALLAERTGSFMCHCGNTGVEQTPNKSQHSKSTLKKKSLLLLLLGFELAIF